MSNSPAIDLSALTSDLVSPLIIEDVRPLLAFVVPLIAVIGIGWAGEKRRNLGNLYISCCRHTSIRSFVNAASYTEWSNY